MQGLLVVNKPGGVTSRDVVNRVQRLVRPTKVGHAGTLDPLATGILVLCLGSATRLTEFIQRMPKHYRSTFLLGRQSETDDVEGEVISRLECPQPTPQQVAETLPSFLGKIQQVPPKYSALNVAGRRAYDLARQGVSFELPARSVHINSLNLVKYQYPKLELDIVCGGGTYVRSLGRDIAHKMETFAVMSALQRTAIGEFCLEEAHHPATLTADGIPHLLLPLLAAVPSLPKIQLSDAELTLVRSGQSICRDPETAGDQISAISPRGELCAILVRRHDGWGPERNLM